MISRDEVLNLAALARLKLTDAEVGALQQDISSILDYVGQVNAIEGESLDLKPPLRNILRNDTVRGAEDPLSRKEEVLRDAFPSRQGGHNVVRKIIEK